MGSLHQPERDPQRGPKGTPPGIDILLRLVIYVAQTVALGATEGRL